MSESASHILYSVLFPVCCSCSTRKPWSAKWFPMASQTPNLPLYPWQMRIASLRVRRQVPTGPDMTRQQHLYQSFRSKPTTRTASATLGGSWTTTATSTSDLTGLM
jgi:hypothetical protein